MKLPLAACLCAACLCAACLCAACFAADAPTPAAIDAIFADYARPGVPGASVIVIRDGKPVFTRAYGLAEREARTVATPATNYRLASVTKQFTAMAVMILADRKRLSYDDPVTRFFPGFPAYGREVTIRRLLNHTSGLKDYESLMPPDQKEQIHDAGVLDLLSRQSACDFPPGSKWSYSNSGYAVLALVVEKASGLRFAEFLRRNIFAPLGMKNTVAFEQGVSTVVSRAYGYSATPSGFERTDQSPTSAVLGDGGIYSSVEDLCQWDQALYGTRLVRAETLRLAFTPGVLNDRTRTAYGFGWEVGEYRGLPTLRHSGSTIGFRNHILRIPEKRFTVVILTNRNGGDPAKLAERIADLYLYN